MKAPPSAGAGLSALAGLAALLASACTPIASPAADPSFDPQACAEEALRRSPDPAVLQDAVTHFSRECEGLSHASSCSLLGVLHELGLGVAPDHPRARKLYRLACELGNARACGNLGELLLADATPGASPADALTLLRIACGASHGRHCAALGRIYDEGTVVPRSPTAAASWFERACARGSVSACVGYADLIERGEVDAERGRAVQLLTMACARGNEEGCDRLSRGPRQRPPGPAPVLVGSTER